MDGVLIINKPAGMTSHDVISRLRKKYHQKKFGHTGTLDPQATGVLVVLAGKATRLLPFLKDTDKEYIAGIELGKSTTTDDIWGEVLEEAPVHTDFDFTGILEGFRGKQIQKIPAASAKKVNGKKLLDYQRQGLEVPELENEIEIYEIEALDPQDLSFRAACSSGTYIRSLCKAIAEKSGNLGVMNRLQRTRASGFTIDQAEELDAEHHTLYPMSILLDLPLVEIPEELEKAIANGAPVHLDQPGERIAFVKDGELAAIYGRRKGDLFVSERGFGQ